MPRKDPMTGCMVMTLPEFWASEDKHAGVEPGTSEQDFWADFDRETKRWVQDHWDPHFAFDLLRQASQEEHQFWLDEAKYYPDHDDPEPLIIDHVYLVLDVDCSERLRSTRENMRALVRCEDGRQYIVQMNASHDSGSYWDPPEDECWLEYEPYQPLG